MHPNDTQSNTKLNDDAFKKVLSVLIHQVFHEHEDQAKRSIEDMPLNQQIYLTKTWSELSSDALAKISSHKLTIETLTELEMSFLRHRAQHMTPTVKDIFNAETLTESDTAAAREYFLKPLLKYKLLELSCTEIDPKTKRLFAVGLTRLQLMDSQSTPEHLQAYSHGLCTLEELKGLSAYQLKLINKYQISFTQLSQYKNPADDFIFTPNNNTIFYYYTYSKAYGLWGNATLNRLELFDKDESISGVYLGCIPWKFEAPRHIDTSNSFNFLRCFCKKNEASVDDCYCCFTPLTTLKSQTILFKKGSAYPLVPIKSGYNIDTSSQKQGLIPNERFYKLEFADQHYALSYREIQSQLVPFGSLTYELELAIAYDHAVDLKLKPEAKRLPSDKSGPYGIEQDFGFHVTDTPLEHISPPPVYGTSSSSCCESQTSFGGQTHLPTFDKFIKAQRGYSPLSQVDKAATGLSHNKSNQKRGIDI